MSFQGYFFHQHSKDEALGDIDLYKMECSRLWRYLDSEIGLSKVYLTFYELILQKIKSHLNGTYSGTSGWGSPKLGINERSSACCDISGQVVRIVKWTVRRIIR